VIPDHYAISITPDLAAAKFSGRRRSTFDVKEPVDTITLSSVGLEMHDVVVASGASC